MSSLNFVHIYPTNILVFKMGIMFSSECLWCSETDHMEHAFFFLLFFSAQNSEMFGKVFLKLTEYDKCLEMMGKKQQYLASQKWT